MNARPSEGGAVLLEARGLGCTYRGRSAPSLADVDLELCAGTVTLVAGGSASGKTSLLRCLNGLVPRAYRGSRVAGRVRCAGEDLARLSPGEVGLRVGTLLQDPARQIVGLDVRRELAFGPENLGLAPERVDERVRRTAARLGIEDLLDRPTAELSGGQRQKVALGGVLAQEPSVLLLDEPLAALDPASAAGVVRLVRELADGGCAVLVVEHRVEDVLAAAPEQVLLLERGRPAWCGDVAGFLERADPRHLQLPVDAAVARWRALAGSAEEGDGDGARPAGSTGEPLLDLEGVRVRFPNGVEALRGASLAVGAGEVVALLGPNGAGKSSLLRHAIGLLRPDAGAVRVLGADAGARTVAALSRDVGYLFQDPGAMLFADTVEEECLFAPRNQGLEEGAARARVRDALARLELEEHAHEPPRALSLGQQKRVCLAAVACQGVRVWVLDEPTAGLDPGGVADFLAALAAGSGGRDGVLIATHDLDLALVHATRVAVMAEGALIADGAPGAVLLDADVRARARLAATSLLEANRARIERGAPPLDARALAFAGGEA